MRACVLTSCPSGADPSVPDFRNGLGEALSRLLPSAFRLLFVCSDPDRPDTADLYAARNRKMFENAGFEVKSLTVLDARNENEAERLVRESGLVFLAGGHVPTQNAFFERIGLRDILAGVDGVLMSLSAGSMNCAREVYAMPEEEGEAKDRAFRRFLPGLGLTELRMLPHWQCYAGETLDGLRLIEDIALPDSRERDLYAFPDGTWLLIENGRETVHGEAFLLRGGRIFPFTRDGETREL